MESEILKSNLNLLTNQVRYLSLEADQTSSEVEYMNE